MRGVAIACFFLSGASGLIFQVIWTRLFSLVFGATSLAISTVLTAFMAGLALGSYLAGRLADRLGNPLKAYAFAEAGVGLLALALPVVVDQFAGVNAWAYQRFEDNWAVLSLLRFCASAVVIIIPTTLMGATLPLLSRYFISTESEHARVGMRVGTLYAINTMGAVLGTFAGGFYLLPTLGLAGTNRLAAMVNLALGALVLFAFYRSSRSNRTKPEHADPALDAFLEEAVYGVPIRLHITPLQRRIVIGAFFFSGGAAMVYQILWSRALAMNIGSSVYSFTLVLTTFLLGLAAGSAAIGRLTQRSRDPLAALAMVHVSVVLLVGLSQALIEHLPYLYLYLIDGSQMNAGTIMGRQFLMAAIVMFPATFAMGGVFPLTIRVASASVDRVGQDVGFAYSVNTMGAIVGSFLAGFVVIPRLQLQPGIYAGIVVSATVAAILFYVSNQTKARRYLGCAVCLGLLVGGPLLPRWDRYQVSVGLFRPTIARDALAQNGRWPKPKLVFYRDGVSTTVSVERWSKKHFSLKNNGKVDASTGEDMPTQIAVGLLPILMHSQTPQLKPDVALIGYASGVTAGAILQFPVRRLDVVELEPAIIEASRFFRHVNHRPLSDPRLRMITDDGRNFLAATVRRYDVIINEPSNPWITGVSNLFTEDYFRIARARLNPHGIFCSWVQMYELGPRRVKAIYRAFANVFPHVHAFSATSLSSDTFLMGSDQPISADITRLRKAVSLPRVRTELRRANIQGADDLVALTLMGPRGIAAFVTGAVANTDDNALVEFAAPLDLLNHRKYDYYVSRVYGAGWAYGRLDDVLRGYQGSEQWARLVRSLLAQGRIREAEHFRLKLHKTGGPRSAKTLALFDLISPPEGHGGEFPLAVSLPVVASSAPDPIRTAKASGILSSFPRLFRFWKKRQCQEGIKLIESWPEKLREAAPKDVHLMWGHLAMICEQPRAAANILEPIYRDPAYRARRPALRFLMGKVFFYNADFAKAVEAYEGWIEHRAILKLPVLPPAR